MVYGLLAICLAVVVGFALAEVGTRALAPASGSAGTLDPGLFRYDARLGWRLSPNWSGRHVHEAYSAAYATNRHGFRGTFERARAPGTTRHAFLGDSFTFGFGVDDGHTFVDLLNAGGRGVSYLNFAVPGYSTDQQALLLADTVLDFAPESVHVVVYLGNDIFDNQRDIPIQGNARKPRFVNSPGGLALEGVPVPRGALPVADAAGGLRAIIFGEDASLGPLGSCVRLVRTVPAGRAPSSQAERPRRSLRAQLRRGPRSLRGNHRAGARWGGGGRRELRARPHAGAVVHHQAALRFGTVPELSTAHDR